MSHTITRSHDRKKQRSMLAVPANQYELFLKAAKSQADAIFLDLEDSVAVDKKEIARNNVIRGLNEINWENKLMLVRINGLDTEYMYQDVIDIVSQCQKLDRILIPKVGVPEDVYALDMLVTQIEKRYKRQKPVAFECLIETALGMTHIDAIAGCCSRIESMSFGLADYAASLGMKLSDIGANHPDYGVLTKGENPIFIENDIWHYAQMRFLNACRSHDLAAIDGPFGDFTYAKGYLTSAKKLAAMGFDGKWAIHPSQINIANDVFTPTDEEVSQAQQIIAAMVEAEQKGLGAVSVDGRMVDIASIKMAQSILAKSAVT